MSVKWQRAIGVLAVCTAALGACAKSDNRNNIIIDPGADMSSTDLPRIDVDPGSDMAAPLKPLSYAGVYNAPAAIDFTAPGALPGLASPALGLLANLHTKPGTALIELGFQAGIGILQGAPSGIGAIGRGILGGLLDTALVGVYMNNPGVDKAVALIQNIGGIAKTTVLNTKLTVHAPVGGTNTYDLEITGATFSFPNVNGVQTTFTAPTSAVSVAAAKTTFTAGALTPRNNPNLADADISFDGGTVTIPMGDYLTSAIGALVFQPLYGVSDFKQGIIALVGCDGIAKSVADAFGGSMITEAVLKGVCVVVVGLEADKIIAEFDKLQVKNVQITAGRGVLYDISTPRPTADRQSDRIGDGAWTWNIGNAHVVSNLAGDRIP